MILFRMAKLTGWSDVVFSCSVVNACDEMIIPPFGASPMIMALDDIVTLRRAGVCRSRRLSCDWCNTPRSFV